MVGADFNFEMVSVCVLPTMLFCPVAMAGIMRQKTAVNIAASIGLFFKSVMLI